MFLLRFISTIALVSSLHVAMAANLSDISSTEATTGLKEALTQGANFAVSSLGKENGFLGNPKVKIPLPDSLRTIEKGMKMFGMGKQADELVATMNHAAEKAVVEAKPILLDSIKKMSVEDAKNILTGGDDSVTRFFKKSSSAQLTEKFLPIVKSATKNVQLAEKYNAFASEGAKFGVVAKEDADIDAYVTHKTVDGLFLMIAEKEKEIRNNPLGSGSDLLKKVFGSLR